MCISESVQALLSEPATYSAIAAGFSAVAAFASYHVNRQSLSSKLTDRLYELDKLIMSNAKSFAKFVKQSGRRRTDYFFSPRTPKTEEYHQLKAFAYYYLNLFDEIFDAYGSQWRLADDVWRAWQHYIFDRLKHPLIKELVFKECGLEMIRGKLVRKGNGSSVFTEGFINFLLKNQDRWKGPCAPDTY